ncbi:hypothetical protein Ahy_B08g091366 [Arachis hypogaea]|uniref:Aminotransferase-like plant mobile domain-containing protein n=1 Tax=Arachis hypogaea TaxID=3818 RepID=A0A444Y1Z5_ARAHY|nr:hypothetical protein Ahy_B08g091366 [Arachis hypogaea]
MARQAGNDGDINRLNETLHYAGAADFERPHLQLPQRTPPDAIVPYLAEAEFSDTVPLREFTFDNSLILVLVERWRPETHTFHLLWGEVTITLQDVAYHLGLRSHGNPIGGCLRDFGRWYGTETWPMVEQLLGARPPVVVQQAVQRKESFTLKMVWLRDRVRQMPPTDDPETLRQQVQQPGSRTLATAAPGLCGVQGIILGLCCAGLDLPVTMFGGTAGRHRHHRMHFTADALDLSEISSVVSTRQRSLPVSASCELTSIRGSAEGLHGGSIGTHSQLGGTARGTLTGSNRSPGTPHSSEYCSSSHPEALPLGF